MNTKARWSPLWALCLVLVSAQTSGQETLWEAYHSAGVKALQEGRSAEAERLFMAAIGRAEASRKQDLRLAQTLNDLGVAFPLFASNRSMRAAHTQHFAEDGIHRTQVLGG